MQISHLNSNSIRWRKAKTATLTLTLYSGGEKKEENNRRRKVSFFWSRRKRGKIFGEDLSKNCQGYWEVLVSVSVSRLLPIFGGFRIQRIWSPKKFRFGFPKIWSQKKSTGFGEFGLGKKVPVLVLENLVSAKKSRFRKIWYRKKSLGITFGQNFGIVIQWSLHNGNHDSGFEALFAVRNLRRLHGVIMKGFRISDDIVGVAPCFHTAPVFWCERSVEQGKTFFLFCGQLKPHKSEMKKATN